MRPKMRGRIGAACMVCALILFGAVNGVGARGAADTGEPDPYTEQRHQLVAASIASERFGRTPVRDAKVLDAMRTVKRHLFVPESQVEQAYLDKPLPIGHGQTISQPYIVATMTEMLQVDENSRVLEIGTGSGYQAAVLAEIVDQVYTIEIVEPLAAQGRKNLDAAGYGTVVSRPGDGYFGWAEHAPFDAIVVTAAAAHIPPPLVEQLRPGGRMVIPVGPPFQTQSLMLVEKQADGTVVQRNLMPVRFVPLTRAK